MRRLDMHCQGSLLK